MKYLRKINEEFGIYSRLWTLKESDFEDFLNGLSDIGCEIEIGYLYCNFETDKYSNSFPSPHDVNVPPPEDGLMPGIVIRIAFYEIYDIDKSVEFYREIAESRDRFLEKFKERLHIA